MGMYIRLTPLKMLAVVMEGFRIVAPSIWKQLDCAAGVPLCIQLGRVQIAYTQVEVPRC